MLFFAQNLHGIVRLKGVPIGDLFGFGNLVLVINYGTLSCTPGLPYNNITRLVFEKTTINLTNGNTFTVIAKGASRNKKYIQKAFINGSKINAPFITHDEIMTSITLELALSEKPNKE